MSTSGSTSLRRWANIARVHGTPSIRAGFLQSNLAAIEALGTTVAERVRVRIGTDRVARIEEASRIAWLPLELDIAVAEAVEAEVGRPGLRSWLRAGVERSAATPLLSPFLSSARAIFGLTPHGFLRRTPQMWSVMYRDCGVAGYEELAGREALVMLADAPRELLASPAELAQLGVGLEAAIGLVSQAGSVEVEVQDRRALFRCRW